MPTDEPNLEIAGTTAYRVSHWGRISWVS